jgi:hypothetical protein
MPYISRYRLLYLTLAKGVRLLEGHFCPLLKPVTYFEDTHSLAKIWIEPKTETLLPS